MNLVLKNALTGFVVLIGLGPVSAFAQDAACSCTTAYQGAAGAIGSVSRVSGDALISQAAGFDVAKVGSSLGFGSRVVVGPRGSASVQVGSCSLDVPANSSLDISRVGGNICLKLDQSAQSAKAENSGGGVGGFGPPEAMFAGALLTSGVLAATQNDDNGVSR